MTVLWHKWHQKRETDHHLIAVLSGQGTRSAVACRGSLEICHSVWRCRDIVPSHVLMHLWEALPHIVFCTAFSHGSKPKPLGWVVELRRWNYRLAESFASFRSHIFVNSLSEILSIHRPASDILLQSAFHSTVKGGKDLPGDWLACLCTLRISSKCEKHFPWDTVNP